MFVCFVYIRVISSALQSVLAALIFRVPFSQMFRRWCYALLISSFLSMFEIFRNKNQVPRLKFFLLVNQIFNEHHTILPVTIPTLSSDFPYIHLCHLIL